MKLLEYEAKYILRDADIRTPISTLVKSASDKVTLPTVLKSQVPVGGRGKLGGVVIVDNQDVLEETIDALLELDIRGYSPNVLLAEEKLEIAAEHYLSLLVDRDLAEIRLIAHKNGGIEVESNKTEDFLNLPADNIETNAGQLAAYWGYETAVITPLLEKLHATHRDQPPCLYKKRRTCLRRLQDGT